MANRQVYVGLATAPSSACMLRSKKLHRRSQELHRLALCLALCTFSSLCSSSVCCARDSSVVSRFASRFAHSRLCTLHILWSITRLAFCLELCLVLCPSSGLCCVQHNRECYASRQGRFAHHLTLCLLKLCTFSSVALCSARSGSCRAL